MEAWEYYRLLMINQRLELLSSLVKETLIVAEAEQRLRDKNLEEEIQKIIIEKTQKN